ncbi:DNA cytosine methyltransferase [Halorubrum tropicale]|uniref:DNA cytosine methyltransferase n=1 Tax=Halorubrum tropicale TaxID=1765655 RepID=UPI00097F9CEE|nr:DNA cytosine methyltransferase [Halorubrum tropicale]
MGSGLTCIDLFSGAGGFSLGFSWAGFDIHAATDYQETAKQTYTENLDAPFLQADIVSLADNPAPLIETANSDLENIDVAIGGPPCKGFSTAGAYNPSDYRSDLLYSYLDVIEQLSPKAIVIENVPSVTAIPVQSSGEMTYAKSVLRETRKLGYKIRMLELDAADFGVPQHRKRVFFIGYKSNVPISEPIPTHLGDGGQQRLGESMANRSYISVGDAISDLAFLGPNEEAYRYQRPPESDYQQWMRGNHDDNELYNHVAPDHGPRVRERFQTLDEGAGKDGLPPRLQTDKRALQKYDRTKPANTVTTLPEDFIHYEQPRIPTVRELARLQSFPDWFEFKGPRTTGGPQRIESLPQYSQVGNAVPPILADVIGRHVKLTFQEGDPREVANARLQSYESGL